MKQILKLVFLLVIGQTAFAQAPSNYTNINGRYRWIAGMFDSTFHIPKGSTPSLRTGGSTNSGGLFYNTSDSSVYTYTGTQWIKLRGSINPSDTTNKYVTQVYKKNASDSVFYVKGGNHLFAFIDSVGSPGGGGGGKVYYFNGGVSMGTFGGFAMYELGDTANTGAAANFTRSTTGNIANFITDPNKPGLLQIPAGVWSVDAWLSETGGGANHAEIWVEVEKWDGSTITTIATSPIEQITEGGTPNLYSWSVSIPTTSLTVTDRIIIQFYISNTNGKTVTLYTQNGYVGEVHTTFTTGIGAINGLTAPAQYLVTGTSGTDFNINSSTATHTFNLPTASATNRGALSTTDWSTFNNKIGGSLVSGYLTKATGTNTIDTSQIFQSSGRIGVSTTSPQTRLMVAETASDGALSILGNASNVGTFKFYANDGSTIQSVVNSSSSAMQIGTFVNSEMNLITNSATRVSILNNGNVGIGSGAATDSMLTVENGARFKRGVRMSALPTGVGTKAVRIDANGTLSVADTLANPISGTGTTNYVTKWTSSSAVGNSQIFDNGTNVGIGTNTPTRTLDVNGIITTNNNLELTSANPTILWTTSNLRFYNNTNGVVATISSAGQLSLSSIPNATTDTDKFLVSDGGVVKYRTGSEILSDIGAASSSSISGTTNYIPKFTSSSAIGNGNLYDNNGDIVINGTTPQNETSGRGSLTINGTQAVLSLSTSNTNAGYLYHNATDLFLYNAKNGVLAFGTNNAERMRLTSGGSLGIGTSSPQATLELYDAGTGNMFNLKRVSSATQASVDFYRANASTTTVTNGDNLGRINAWGYDGSAYSSIGAGIDFTVTGTVASNSIPGSIIFRTNAVGSQYASEKMRLDASGNLIVGGTSASARLQIVGSFGSQLRIQETGGTYFDIAAGGRFDLKNAAGTTIVSIAQSGSPVGTQLNLDASGNLGLGVTPSAWGSVANLKALQIGPGALFTQDYLTSLNFNSYYDGSQWKYITTEYATRYRQYQGEHAWFTAPSGTAGNAISFTQAMTLDASGRLLLGGTVSSGAKLQVISSTSTTTAAPLLALGQSSNGSDKQLMIWNDLSNNYFAFQGLTQNVGWNQNIVFQVNGGNVGIGTTSPTYKLDIYGGASGTRTDVFVANAAANYNIGVLSDNNGFASTTNAMLFYTAATERMRITSGGNVLVNATSGDGGVKLYLNNGFNGLPVTTGTTQTYGALRLRGGDDAVLDFGLNSTNTWIQATNKADLSYYYNILLNPRGGNVGIGTTSPSNKLSISGSLGDLVSVTNGTSTIYTYVDNNGGGIFSSTTAGGAGIYLRGTNIIDYYIGGNNAMRLNSGGELLINTTSDAGDYKLQVNGAGYFGGVNVPIYLSSNSSNGTIIQLFNNYSTSHTWGLNAYTNGNLYFQYGTTNPAFLSSTGNLELSGSIKTAAPSGGTAKPWKFGEAGVSVGGANTTAVKVEIDGVVYYLLTAYLPEPTPEPAPKPKPEG